MYTRLHCWLSRVEEEEGIYGRHEKNYRTFGIWCFGLIVRSRTPFEREPVSDERLEGTTLDGYRDGRHMYLLWTAAAVGFIDESRTSKSQTHARAFIPSENLYLGFYQPSVRKDEAVWGRILFSSS